MKTIYFLLISFGILLSSAGQAQISPSHAHTRAFQMYQKKSIDLAKGDRGAGLLLDSTVCEIYGEESWEPGEKTFYHYDENEMLAKDSIINWLGDHWAPVVKHFYAYTAVGQLYTNSQIEWNSASQEWAKDTLRYRNEYDNGRLVAVWTETFDPLIGEWDTFLVDSLRYDDEGVLIGQVAYFTFGNGMVPVARIFYGYEDGLLAADIFQFSFDGQGWINFFRQFYYYEDGLLSVRRLEYYDEETFNFFEAEMETYAYGENDELVHTEVFVWFDEWLPAQRCDYYYSQGQPSSIGGGVPIPLAEIRMANPFPGGQAEAPALDAAGSYEVVIFNAMGQPVFRQTLSGASWQLPAMPGPGFYALVVQSGGRVLATRKFVAAN
jgi:hypothetical protein